MENNTNYDISMAESGKKITDQREIDIFGLLEGVICGTIQELEQLYLSTCKSDKI